LTKKHTHGNLLVISDQQLIETGKGWRAERQMRALNKTGVARSQQNATNSSHLAQYKQHTAAQLSLYKHCNFDQSNNITSEITAATAI